MTKDEARDLIEIAFDFWKENNCFVDELEDFIKEQDEVLRMWDEMVAKESS